LPREADDVEDESSAIVAHGHQLTSKALFWFALVLLHKHESFPEPAPEVKKTEE
jgi:hypothetical protein